MYIFTNLAEPAFFDLFPGLDDDTKDEILYEMEDSLSKIYETMERKRNILSNLKKQNLVLFGEILKKSVSLDLSSNDALKFSSIYPELKSFFDDLIISCEKDNQAKLDYTKSNYWKAFFVIAGIQHRNGVRVFRNE